VRAQEVTFLDLIQGEKQFQVPLYQRTYSWLDGQLAQLWRDIREQGEAMAGGTPRTGHFLGSVVIAPSPTLHAAGVQRWLVVDGQQRLTTLMLALTAIRDHTQLEGDDTAADRIHRQYLVNEFRQGDDHLRLLPTQADRDAYRALALRTAAAEPAGNIAEAYRFFRTALVAADDPDDDEDILRIEQTIRAGLSIVEITAERGVAEQHRIAAKSGRPAAQLHLHATAATGPRCLRRRLASHARQAIYPRSGAARLARLSDSRRRQGEADRNLSGATGPP
jgi:hypothetical protein